MIIQKKLLKTFSATQHMLIIVIKEGSRAKALQRKYESLGSHNILMSINHFKNRNKERIKTKFITEELQDERRKRFFFK